MLLIEIPKIPPEGLDLDEALDPASLRVEAEGEFRLLPGGRVRGRVEIADGATVHIRGPLAAAVELECGRCLERYAASLDQELDLFYLPRSPGQQDEQEDEVALSDRDVVVGYYDGERLDLGDALREQLYLTLPLKRLCREDCRGLCPTCGKNLNAGACGCPPPEESEDPRLSPLRGLIDKK
jgi:uncharacterized protein